MAKAGYVRGTPEERFWPKVEKRPSGCWIWIAAVDSHGYGVFRGDGHVRAHRFSYALAHGPIPPGLTLDHLCRTRACVNPAHLELVTNAENILRGDGPTARNARKTHCSAGHPFSGDNLRVRRDGARTCIACERRRAA